MTICLVEGWTHVLTANSEIDSHIHSQLIFYNTQMQFSGERVFSTHSLHHRQKIDFDLNLTHYRKNNSEWIIDLNGKYKTIKLSEDSLGQVK